MVCLPRVLVISVPFCSFKLLDVRVGGLGAVRLGAGEGAGGGRRLVTCLTSGFPLVSPEVVVGGGLFCVVLVVVPTRLEVEFRTGLGATEAGGWPGDAGGGLELELPRLLLE